MKTNYRPSAYIQFKDRIEKKEKSLKTELKVLNHRRKKVVKELMDLDKKIIDTKDELSRLVLEKI
jgi:predicted  nucleic acid-binding Zn-ribbon protein